MRKKMGFLLGVAVIVFALGFPSSLLAQGKIATLGMVGDFSGPLGGMGTAERRGALLAKDFINQDGGFTVAGQKYTLNIVDWDSRTDPKEAVAGFIKLIEEHKVKMIIGCTSSGAQIAGASISEPRKVITITTAASLDVLRPGIKYTFRTVSSTDARGKAFTTTYLRMGVKSLALASQNSKYCQSMRESIKATLARDFPDVKLVGDEVYEPGTTDFYSMLTKLKAKNPDILFLAPQPADGGLICKQRLEIGWPVVVVATSDLQSSRDFFQVAGKGVEGVFDVETGAPTIVTDAVAKVMGMNIELRRRLENAYKEKYKEPTINVTAMWFDAVYMAVNAMVKAGTIDDTDKIREAMLLTDFSGALGRTRFDSRGQAKAIDVITRFFPDPQGMKRKQHVAVTPISPTNFESSDINPLPTIMELRAQYKY